MRSSYFNFSVIFKTKKINLRSLPYEVLEGSPKPTDKRQLLGRLPEDQSLIQQNFQAFLKSSPKKACFESPKHSRTRRDDLVLEAYKSDLGPST